MDDLSSIARELRLARENLGFTRERLAEKVGYTASYIEKIETGALPATEPFITATAPVLGPGIDPSGLFGRLRADEKREIVPDWFRPWVDQEQAASEIRSFGATVIPGLLQTESYAMALLGDPERVQARLERQRVLETAKVIVIIDESILNRQRGTREVMAEQCRALLETRGVVHVLPEDADTNLGVDGPFLLATVDGQEVGYVDTPARGFIVPDPGVLSGLRERWAALLAESLPRSLSRELIKKAAERWTTG